MFRAPKELGIPVFVVFLSWSSPRGSNVEGLGKQNSLLLLEIDDKFLTEKN